MSNELAHRETKYIGAYVQGLSKAVFSDFCTGERLAVALVLEKHGVPPSGDVLSMWLEQEGAPEIDVSPYYRVRVNPEEMEPLAQHLAQVATRFRLENDAANQLALIGREGSGDLAGDAQRIINHALAPLGKTRQADETEEADLWMNAHIQGEAGMSGYRMKWSPLMGAILGPRSKNQMIVIGGREKSGKSAWTFQDALDVAYQGGKALYVSPDMGARKCYARLVSILSGIPYMRLWNHSEDIPILDLHEQERAQEARRYLRELPIKLSGERWTPNLMALIQEWEPDAVYLDYLALFRSPGSPDTTSQEQATATVSWARYAAKLAFICVVSQVKVGSKPDAENYGWTSEIKNAVDACLWVIQDRETGIIIAKVLANRGPTGEVPYHLYGPTMYVQELPSKAKGLSW